MMGIRAHISTAADDRSTRLAGIVLMLAAVGMFAFGDALGKYIVATYSVGQLMLLRACAALVLGEHVGWRRWSAILIGFGGVLIALRPSAQTVSWPAMIALAGSLAFSMLLLITRSLRGTPDIGLAAPQFGGGLVFGVAIAPVGWIAPTWGSLGFFFAAGAISA